jgi:hypothetical protein
MNEYKQWSKEQIASHGRLLKQKIDEVQAYSKTVTGFEESRCVSALIDAWIVLDILRKEYKKRK